MERPKIVILGAGYGGLITTKKLEVLLKEREAEITLINKHDYHYITTQLHRTGAGTASDNRITLPVNELIDHRYTNFIKGEATSIDFVNQHVVLEKEEAIPYDYLVIALGFDIDTFGIPGVKENAFQIRSFKSTKAIYNHINKQMTLYKEDEDPSRLIFVVAGGGFTGIEMAGELAEGLPALCKTHGVPLEKVKIINVEAAPTLLPGYNKKLIDYTEQLCKKKGIEVMTSTKILECSPTSILLDNGSELASRTLIWSGGVRGNKLLEKTGLTAQYGKVPVNKFLEVPEAENVFCIGDCSLFMKEDSTPLPPTAQVAIQQAQVCGENIVKAIRKEKMKPFKYHHKGTVASIGSRAAVGKVGSLKITGLLAALMKHVIETRYLLILGGPMLFFKQLFRGRRTEHRKLAAPHK